MSTLWLMLAALVVTYCISERLVSPIRAMSKAAKCFAKGQFDARVPVRGDDEIAELASAFNNMASSLASNEEMRRLFLANVSHDLRTPMTTISGFIDGILVCGAQKPRPRPHTKNARTASGQSARAVRAQYAFTGQPGGARRPR